MADKPLYYSSKSSPLYYGGTGKSSPLYYGGGAPSYGGQPMYYGSGPKYGGPSSYGSYGAYGAYGAYGSYGGDNSSGSDNGSVVGAITFGRVLRVISQRWLSVFVFVLVGLIVSFAVYRVSPTIYQACSEFTLDLRRAMNRGNSALEQAMPDMGSTYGEIFNTRISDWRSDKIVTMIVQQYRASHPASTISDGEITEAIGRSHLELQRNSRIITITVRSKSAQLAAAVANAYAEAIESFTDEENKLRCDKAVSQIHNSLEKKRREVDKLKKQILDFRTANKVDNLRSQRETIHQSFSKTTTDILALESTETQLAEWEKVLASVKDDPESFGNLSMGMPRAEEIGKEYRAFQDASSDCAKLLFTYTENHPEVIAAKRTLEITRKRFLDAASRALQTGRAALQIARNQILQLKRKQEELRSELGSLEQRIVLAESGLDQLQAEFNVATEVMKGLQLDESKARLQAENNNEIVRVGRPAGVPGAPILPNPKMIFGAGAIIALGLGFLFVLVLDNLEDTIVNLADIEGRLSLKVLAVLPHVRRKKREQVAKFLIEDKYSQFAEAIAGYRNLLDSPRYESMTKCLLYISTQPGEGKTITSTSTAIAWAQTGKKVLHVDFDLRRPRVARIWDLTLTEERSFSHVLARSAGRVPDFSALVNSTSVEGLDVIASLPPEGISPATILGSSVIPEFFVWARANYDRVVVDAPPYGLVGDVVSLAVLADSVVIMCCPDRTHFKPILHCSRALTEAGANILGAVVNDVEVQSAKAFSPAGHHRSYRSGYGYGYGYQPKRTGRGDGDNPDASAKGADTAVVREELDDDFADED